MYAKIHDARDKVTLKYKRAFRCLIHSLKVRSYYYIIKLYTNDKYIKMLYNNGKTYNIQEIYKFYIVYKTDFIYDIKIYYITNIIYVVIVIIAVIMSHDDQLIVRCHFNI